jgi:hypothetical protein
MRFLDDNINLRLEYLGTGGGTYKFKAFIEKSDIAFKIEENPIGIIRSDKAVDKQLYRIVYDLSFSFNVFSESREEAYQNFNKLNGLLPKLRPEKIPTTSGLLNTSEVFGDANFRVHFSGFPQLGKTHKNSMDIVINSFTYTINKDMGYIELPIPQEKALYTKDKMVLVPISYKIDFSGRITSENGVNIDPPGGLTAEQLKTVGTGGGAGAGTTAVGGATTAPPRFIGAKSDTPEDQANQYLVSIIGADGYSKLTPDLKEELAKRCFDKLGESEGLKLKSKEIVDKQESLRKYLEEAKKKQTPIEEIYSETLKRKNEIKDAFKAHKQKEAEVNLPRFETEIKRSVAAE